LALTSNRRQDFKMSQWALKEALPAFAIKPELCTKAGADGGAGPVFAVEYARAHPDGRARLCGAVGVGF